MKISRTGTIYLLLAVVFFSALYAAAPISAQSPTRVVTDDEVNDIAKDLYCPVCESTPLDVCPTQACADWREVIRTKLSEGQTPDQIEAYFELQYGARALAEPPREGFTLAVWILPIAAIVAGVFFFGRYLRNLRAAEAPELAPPSLELGTAGSPSEVERDEYEARIERELRERYQ